MKVHNKEAFEENLGKLAALPGRRVVKSHLPWKRLPTALQKSHSTKVKFKPKPIFFVTVFVFVFYSGFPLQIVYVARHPKDICISLFYFNRILPAPEYHKLGSDLERFCHMFLKDQSKRLYIGTKVMKNAF